MKLKDANSNWSSRPADQRFWTLEDLRQYLERRDARSIETAGRLVGWTGAERSLLAHTDSGATYKLSPWAFEQACRRLQAPADFIGTQALLRSAYETAEQHEADGHGSPSTAWGFAQGLTRLSQGEPNYDRRRAVDAVASKVLALAR
jgi:hypothetical protein